MAVYYATKAFLLHFSEGLSEELAGSGIGVTCLCPGPTRTGFAAGANVDRLRAFRLTAMALGNVARLDPATAKVIVEPERKELAHRAIVAERRPRGQRHRLWF